MNQFSRLQLILIVAVVALLGVNIFLAVGYFGAVSRQGSLQSDIDAKERTIANMPDQADIDALTRQRDQAQRELDEEALIPSQIDPLELLDHIIYVMQKAGLDVYTYKPGTGSTERISGHTYRALTYSITNIRERLSELIDLLQLIEELPYDTLAVRDVTLTSAGDIWSLQFKIVIVTQ